MHSSELHTDHYSGASPLEEREFVTLFSSALRDSSSLGLPLAHCRNASTATAKNSELSEGISPSVSTVGIVMQSATGGAPFDLRSPLGLPLALHSAFFWPPFTVSGSKASAKLLCNLNNRPIRSAFGENLTGAD